MAYAIFTPVIVAKARPKRILGTCFAPASFTADEEKDVVLVERVPNSQELSDIGAAVAGKTLWLGRNLADRNSRSDRIVYFLAP